MRDEVLAAALRQAEEFVAAGCDILDVGAESTRPAQFYGERPTALCRRRGRARGPGGPRHGRAVGRTSW